VDGGSVGIDLVAYGTSTITMTGGTVGDFARARDYSPIRVLEPGKKSTGPTKGSGSRFTQPSIRTI